MPHGSIHFEHQDWLGTERFRTGVAGATVGTYSSLPFGDGYSYTGADSDTYHYATLDQDNSANEHAQFREYSDMQGRWFSPDPYQGSYDPTNPQSFNRYAYVLNNPLSFLDMAGLGPCDLTGLTGNSCTVWVFGGPIVGGGGGDRSEQGPGDPLIYLGSRHGGGAGTGSGHNNPSDPQTKQQKCESIYGNYVNAVADQREVNSISVAGAAFVGFAIGTKIGGPVAGYFSATGAAAAQFISEWDAGWNMDPINIEYASQLNNAGCFAGGWNTN